MAIKIEVWLYGELSKYGDERAQKGFASLHLDLEEGITIAELLQMLKMPTQKRGITFINGNLSALPGLQPDLNQIVNDGDRISFFDHRSMWPFQYRHGAAMSEGLAGILETDPEVIMHHQQKENHAEGLEKSE
ncbi:MAG: MoaD/ThiS family protein [Anaerolineaceae bacterium]|nr:MoaD/ThiS family protein [Anaerolineaceae bacterium]